MERVVDETGWNQKRYDIRTYTAQNMSGAEESVQRGRYRMNIFI